MTLSDVKSALTQMGSTRFQLPDGSFVPEHFHVTEVGSVTKHFIDCGGAVRTINSISFQLWEAMDYDHRLAPQKLLNIIRLSEEKLGLKDAEVEVEYQQGTIGVFALEFDGNHFKLTNKSTACLASDSCGVPAEKMKVSLESLNKSTSSSCKPDGGCC